MIGIADVLLAPLAKRGVYFTHCRGRLLSREMGNSGLGFEACLRWDSGNAGLGGYATTSTQGKRDGTLSRCSLSQETTISPGQASELNRIEARADYLQEKALILCIR